MSESYVTSTGLPDRLTIDEAADLVVKATEKPRDYVISFLTDCAEQGYFSAVAQRPSDYGNVSHISRVDSTKSTVSTTELIEWLNSEIEEAHQRAREAIARRESQKWGYEIKPEDVRVTLASTAAQLRSVAEDETVSMTPRDWLEYLAVEVAERQQWAKAERDAKLPTVRAEYLNLFGQLSTTLPLRQELTGVRWAGDKLPNDWLTRFHVSKPDLREWATSYAPEIAKSRILAERTIDSAADSLNGESDDTTTPDVESRVAWKDAVKKQWRSMLRAHGGERPPAKKILAWFKANDQEGTFKPGGSDEEFFWVGADGTKTHRTGQKAFSNAIAEMKQRGEIPG